MPQDRNHFMDQNSTPARAARSRGALFPKPRLAVSLLFLMNGFVVGRDEAEVTERGRRLAEWRGQDPDGVEQQLAELRGTWLVGTTEQLAERLAAYEVAGVRRVMLQHHLYDDDAALELMAGLGG